MYTELPCCGRNYNYICSRCETCYCGHELVRDEKQNPKGWLCPTGKVVPCIQEDPEVLMNIYLKKFHKPSTKTKKKKKKKRKMW